MASKRTPPPTSQQRMDDKLALALGAAARAARLRAGLTQAEAAEKVGLAPGVYGRIERGGMMPSVPTLRRLSIVLKIPSDTLLSLSHSEVTAWVDSLPARDERPPDLRRLARSLRNLSPAQLKVLNVIATALTR
ncbi:helix-turn-helix transcriptional regulator [Vitiosangium sp. GDMCC 1.1324]|uniref:helix-turn-helix transcriptional regulator n=1 Tax=Vitiosangium sp. (strain GDMCC 1.1324) TaxID=2138576 RepID=UPI000D359B57|nr:helix-turn-helix transcriptional regulator [Vitiosangium sp. GDMCC 1.1324]PTL84399.1 transcriptional regulator [Vitiosangium sp. GDMCC 1.1324]